MIRPIAQALLAAVTIVCTLPSARGQETAEEHAQIGVVQVNQIDGHTAHPDAQWFGQAGLGLFIHWGISSVKAMNISWPMIPGRPLAKHRITDPNERERIVRQADWNLNGRPPQITPNQYWQMARDFNPTKYDPNKWLKAAKEAGFVYAVLTAKHHEGFALWPSNYGNFNTKNWMGGRDLVKEFVDACRTNGLKVGLYFSGPDWYFDKEYMNFLYSGAARLNPELPSLDADLKVRTSRPDPEAQAAHHKAYAEMVRGQIEELLTRYGKIDLIWFDGRPNIPNARDVISIERIRQLQPGIVINPRLHGKGDFVTYERTLPVDKPVKGWAEFCNTWTSSWSHQEIPFRAPGFVIGQFVRCRSLGINYLLGVGPMADGQFCDEIYKNMAILAKWMQQNGESVKGTTPLPANESADVPATAGGSARYLFALPRFKEGGAYEKDLLPPEDLRLTLTGVPRPVLVRLLSDGIDLRYGYQDGQVIIDLPASKRTPLVDVVKVELGPKETAAGPAWEGLIRTPRPPDTPRINGPAIFGVRPGHPFFYRIPATGLRPMRFAADGLPEGLSLDPNTGQITGTLKQPGQYILTLRASNAIGTSTRRFKIVVGETIALTPAMGWNSWNCWGPNVDADKVLRAARAMVSTGLIDHGWTYINIDDAWQGQRGGPYNAIQGNQKFPDMKALCDQIHAMGLKVGIYSTPWVTSYAGYCGGSAENPDGRWEKPTGPKQVNRKILPWAIGRYSFANNDARQWADWGIDYLKYDWNPNELPETLEMYNALRQSGRDIILSLSNSMPFANIPQICKIANSWRTSGDIRDNWRSMSSKGFGLDKWAPYQSPGHWNDPDMLVIGVVGGWGGRPPKPTGLTPDEQYTHLTIWCLVCSPLLLGCDLERLDEFTLNLITNDEVLAVNQDELGKQAICIASDPNTKVYAKPMADGSKAVGLFNLADQTKGFVKVRWSDLGIEGPHHVRDLWRQKELGVFDDGFGMEVAPHGAELVRIYK